MQLRQSPVSQVLLKCLHLGDQCLHGNTSRTIRFNFLGNDETAKHVTLISSSSCALHLGLAGFCARSTILAGFSHVFYFNLRCLGRPGQRLAYQANLK
jgi:hypothetical protein